MSTLDFLFEGQPPPSTTTYGTGTQDLPRWLSDYTRQLISQANAVAGEGYQPYGGPRLADLTPDQLRAFDITREGSGSYIPGMQAAQGAVQGALGSAQPFINQAARTYPQAAQEYMDPYVENVIDRAGTLAKRQLDEKFLPSVQGVFGAAGSGPRSTQMRATVDRGVRDLTEGLHEQALGALSQGYQQGAQTFGADAGRAGALAGTVGNLSLESGRLGGALAESDQNLRLRDAAAQEAIGRVQQGETQRSLDLARSDFEAQRDYPRNQIDWLSGVIRGTPTDRSSTTTATGPGDLFQPSPLGQLGALATGVGGILEAFKKDPQKAVARGGRIRHPVYRARGGALRYAHA